MSFGNDLDWIAVNQNDLMFSGDVSFEANKWNNIIFNRNAFEYDGNSNIVLVVNDKSGHYESSISFNVFNASSQAIRVYSDYVSYDPTTPPSSYNSNEYHALLNVKNQIKLCTEEGWTLPINLLEFYATPDHLTPTPTNNIYIKTGGEWNNCEYIIYRSPDAINWDYDNPVIDWDFSDNPHDASVNANYSEHSYMEYFPIDYNPYDTTYYKLIQRDCDNTAHEYTSEIIVCINVKQKKSAWDYFSYTYEGLMVSSSDKPITIACYNILGQTIYQTDIPSDDNIVLTIKPPYICVIYCDGEIAATERVLK